MDRVRQSKIIDIDALRGCHVGVIGVGAVGSYTVASLAKMGVGKIEMWDFDSVESHNLPNQWYAPSDLGRPKVEALLDAVGHMVDDVELIGHVKRYGAEPMPRITVCAVDSMRTRHLLWKHVQKQRERAGNPALYIDSRMGAEVGQVYCVTEDKSDSYAENCLFDPEQVQEAPCTAKATVYAAAITSAAICAQVKRFLTDGDALWYQELDMVYGQHWSLAEAA